MQMRQMVTQDGEDVIVRANDQKWIASWHPPLVPPNGTPHGASGVCVTGDGEIVLISPDGDHWGLPGGRTEAFETWEETLRREMHEEACASVIQARLLGFSRSVCVEGTLKGLILVRSFWRAEVELATWKPQFEIPHRRVFPKADVWNILVTSHSDGPRQFSSAHYTRRRRSRLEESGKRLVCVTAGSHARDFKLGTDGLRWQVNNRIGRILEHLPDDFTTGQGVGASLDLNQRRNGVLIQEEMVECLPPSAPLLAGDGYLTRDQ